MTESEKEEKQLGRPGCRREIYNVDSKEIGWKFVDCIYLTHCQFGESLWSCENENGTVSLIQGKEYLHWLGYHNFFKITDASGYLYNEQNVSNIMRLSHIHISRNTHC
jgi:hypothetical protein